MDGAAFKYEGSSIICFIAFHSGKEKCKGVILFPGGIQSVIFTAPCIKGPVDCPDLAGSVFYKCGSHIPGPGVISFDLKYPDILNTGQLGYGTFICGFACCHKYFFAFGDGAYYILKGESGGFGPVRPRTGTLRPYHYASAVRFEFSGHIKSVFPGKTG